MLVRSGLQLIFFIIICVLVCGFGLATFIYAPFCAGDENRHVHVILHVPGTIAFCLCFVLAAAKWAPSACGHRPYVVGVLSHWLRARLIRIQTGRAFRTSLVGRLGTSE